MSVQDIQILISFTNFYWHFIQKFNKISVSLIAILKITGLSVISAFRVDNDEVFGSDSDVEVENSGSVDISKKISAKSKSQTKSGQLDNNNEMGELKFWSSELGKSLIA